MTQPPTVPPPPFGLGSGSNYYLYTNCNPIVDLSVTINVTEDIVWQSTSPSTPPCTPRGTTPDNGFGFQLNANSPSGETIASQQYVIALLGGELVGIAYNWPLGLAASNVHGRCDLTLVPEALTLPAGYQLKIILRNNYWRTTWALAAAGSWAGPADRGLLLYDQFNGTGAFYAIGGGGGMDKLAQYDDWRTSWDLAVTGDWGGGGRGGLLLYDRSTGNGAFYAIDSHGGMHPLRQYDDWRTSWDLAVTGGWAGPGNSGLLLYDRSNGNGAFYRIDSHGEMHLLQQYDLLGKGSWDLAVTGGWAGPGNSGLLLYNRAAGTGAFYAIDSHGEMHLLQQSGPLGGGGPWDLAVTGGWAGPGNSGLLLYDRAAGVGAFYAVNSHGEMTLLRQYDDWRTSWDLAVAGGWAGPGNSGLLLYDRTAGVGAFYRIDSHGEMHLLQQYDDSIAGATYIVTDNHGRVRADATIILTSISSVNPADDLSPITAFQLNIVGPDNGGISVLSSGAGTIVYEASTPLTALPTEPPCIDGGFVTCEAANSVYGLLPAGASNTFTQSFNITQAPMIRKEGKVRLSLMVRPDSVGS
jgi:hypothetical protein